MKMMWNKSMDVRKGSINFNLSQIDLSQITWEYNNNSQWNLNDKFPPRRSENVVVSDLRSNKLFVLESENKIELRVEKYETFYQIYNPYHVSWSKPRTLN